MLDWPQLAAMAVALSALGTLFLFIVKLLVGGAIREAINGFSSRLAVLEQKQNDDRAKQAELYTYAHTIYHSAMNKVVEAQVEAFRAGKEAGRSGGRQ